MLILQVCYVCPLQEICEDPQMVVGGASRFDIMQGVLGGYNRCCCKTTVKLQVLYLCQSFMHKFGFVTTTTPPLFAVHWVRAGCACNSYN